jgi:hypothetical protein
VVYNSLHECTTRVNPRSVTLLQGCHRSISWLINDPTTCTLTPISVYPPTGSTWMKQLGFDNVDSLCTITYVHLETYMQI